MTKNKAIQLNISQELYLSEEVGVEVLVVAAEGCAAACSYARSVDSVVKSKFVENSMIAPNGLKVNISSAFRLR